MILMFVSNDDAGQIGGCHLKSFKATFGFPNAEAAIKHDRGTGRAGLGGDK
jgi:hypothetical protein